MTDQELIKKALKGLKTGAVAEIRHTPQETQITVYPHGKTGELRDKLKEPTKEDKTGA